MKPQNIALNSQGRPFLIDVGQLANQVRAWLVTSDVRACCCSKHSRAPRATRVQRGASSAHSSGSRCASKQVHPAPPTPNKGNQQTTLFAPRIPFASNTSRYQLLPARASLRVTTSSRFVPFPSIACFCVNVYSTFAAALGLGRYRLGRRLLHLEACEHSLTQSQSHAFDLTSLILLRFLPNLAKSWRRASVLWRSRSVPVVRPRLRCSGC